MALIALSMISQLSGASAKGNIEIREELHKLVHASLISAMIKAADACCCIEKPNVSQAKKVADAFVKLCCFEVLPREFSLVKPTLEELQKLCQACGHLLSSSVWHQPGSQDRIDMDMLTASCDLWAKLRFICSHPSGLGIDYEGMTFIYQPMNSLSAVLTMMTAIRSPARTPVSESAAFWCLFQTMKVFANCSCILAKTLNAASK